MFHEADLQRPRTHSAVLSRSSDQDRLPIHGPHALERTVEKILYYQNWKRVSPETFSDEGQLEALQTLRASIIAEMEENGQRP